MISYRSLAVLAGAVVLASCGDKNAAQNIAGPVAGSAVKFFNFGVNDPAVNFYVNDQKVTAGSSAGCSSNSTGQTTDTTCLSTGKEATVGTNYGSAANGTGLYSSIAPGSYTLSGRVAAATNHNAAISNTSATLQNGKFYSYYLSGIYDTTSKTVEAFVVEDPLPDFNYDVAYVRFVNAISNSQPLTLTATEEKTGKATAVGGAVAYKSAGTFVVLTPNIAYDFGARAAGATTDAVTRTGVSFSPGRVYTITAYGDINATSGTNKPALDVTANR